MSVKLLFPAYVFKRDFLGRDSHKDMSMHQEYFDMMKNEIDMMERTDHQGRSVSNQGRGWQSNDGVDHHPTFVKCVRAIKRTIRDEMMPFMGLKDGSFRIDFHNSWANKNYNGSWNAPHLHNGCYYSGVLYIHADGDEGLFRAIDTDHKVMGIFPSTPRMAESWSHEPKSGVLLLFPSGLMHMVEPNPTDKPRYSISFNFNVEMNELLQIGDAGEQFFREDMTYGDLEFEIDEKGNLIP